MKKNISIGIVLLLLVYLPTLSSAADWPMFRHDAAHSGVAGESVEPPLELLWKYRTDGRIYSSPAVSGGVVYVGSEDTYVYALDASTGSLKWKYKTGSYVYSSPAISGGIIYVGSFDNQVYALDANTGSLKWKYGTSDPIGSPTVSDGVVYVGSWDSYVYALDANTGNLKWKYKTGYAVGSSPAVSGGVVYVGSWDSYVYALDGNTGNLKWKYGTANPVVSSSAVSGDIVYVGSGDGYVYAIDSSTGSLKWKYKTSNWIESSPAISGDIVYVGSNDSYVYAMDASTGNLKWKYKTGSDVRSSPAVSKSIVYVGSYDYYVYAIDDSTGSLKWKYRTDGLVNSPIVSGGVVYVGSGDGNIYAFTPASTPTPTPTTGTISISSTPSGASIYLDGSYQGKTPKTIPDVSAGSHYIELKLDGYNLWSDSVDVAAGGTSYVSAPLVFITAAATTRNPTSTPTKTTSTPKPSLTIQLPTGHTTIRNGFTDYGNSGFRFDSASVVAWNSKQADILASSTKPTDNSLVFFLQYDAPPYQGEQDKEAWSGIIEMPQTKLEQVTECPSSGYKYHWAEAKVNAVYCVRTRDGQHFAKIKVIQTENIMVFDWIYQPNGSRYFGSVTDFASTKTSLPVAPTAPVITPPPSEPEANWVMIGGIGALILLGIIAISKLRSKKEKKSEAVPLEPPSPKLPSEFPSELKNYTNIELIGEGGFAWVFKANRKKDSKTIAVKIPRLDEKTGRAFLNEITAWHNLNHENIVKLFDANVYPVPYLEMEYIGGVEISGGRIRDLEHYPKPLKEEKAVDIIKSIATGLEHAHTKGVVHRDLKPLNVLITSRLTPKITDFGLAKLSAESKLSTLKGYSPLYAAPEQLDSATYGKPDERTDIYQLGVIFYELLTGKLPYEGYTQSEVSTKIITPAILPTRPSAHNPVLEKYDDIVMKCLAKKKEDRFKDVHEFLEQLETSAKKESLVEQLKKTLNEQKETLKKSKSSEEIVKSKRMVVEILGKLAVIHADSENKVELLNALEDMKFYTIKNLGELSKAIEQLEFMIKNKDKVSEQFVSGIKNLVHKIRREYEL